MALLSSSVIAELDKRKQLRDTKAALTSSPGLARRPLHQSPPSQHKSTQPTPAEVKQVTIINPVTGHFKGQKFLMITIYSGKVWRICSFQVFGELIDQLKH